MNLGKLLGLGFYICKIRVVERKKGKEVGEREEKRQEGSWLVSIWGAATLGQEPFAHFLKV